jgi:two-component system CheB/CheR fusion protein
MQLESELHATKERLQSTVEELETSNEELKSSNEELLSTNEELQSTNEELQTSKEELQSVNEELETINAELSKKVLELDRANGDLENLFHSTQIPTLFLSSDLRIMRFTEAATALYRLIDADVGRPITDIAPRFGGDLVADMKQVSRTLAPREREVRLGDGSGVFVARILPYRRLDNVIDGLVLTFADVTKLEQANEQRTKLAAIVASAHDAIVSRMLDGPITSWNAAAARLLGHTEEEALGKPLSLIVPPDRLAEMEQAEALLRRGEVVPPFESVRVTKDGQRLAVWVAVSPVKDVSGLLIGSAGIFRDLSDLKQAQGLIEDARRKDRFLAVLSHELRSPLASLQICIDILARPETDAERRGETMKIVQRQLEQITALVDQLLDASRVVNGRVPLNLRVENLVDIVRTTVEDQRAALEDAGLELKTELTPRPLSVSCDPLRVSQVIGNLLDNAAKFTDLGGTVTVTVRSEDHARTAIVGVRDTGIGIDPLLLPRLFQPFSQGDAGDGPVRSRRGLGLGLSLVRGLVEAQGGTVEIRSEGRGRGTEALLRFPLLADVPSGGPAAPDPTAPQETQGKARRILVVEDLWDTAQSLRTLLELGGHTIQVAADGKSALEKTKTFRPDVILCDIGLPGGMDGYQIAAAIRGDPAYGSPYLIAFTGYGQAADKEKALQSGFHEHVTKAQPARVLLRLLAELPTTRPTTP